MFMMVDGNNTMEDKRLLMDGKKDVTTPPRPLVLQIAVHQVMPQWLQRGQVGTLDRGRPVDIYIYICL